MQLTVNEYTSGLIVAGNWTSIKICSLYLPNLESIHYSNGKICSNSWYKQNKKLKDNNWTLKIATIKLLNKSLELYLTTSDRNM